MHSRFQLLSGSQFDFVLRALHRKFAWLAICFVDFYCSCAAALFLYGFLFPFCRSYVVPFMRCPTFISRNIYFCRLDGLSSIQSVYWCMLFLALFFFARLLFLLFPDACWLYQLSVVCHIRFCSCFLYVYRRAYLHAGVIL